MKEFRVYVDVTISRSISIFVDVDDDEAAEMIEGDTVREDITEYVTKDMIADELDLEDADHIRNFNVWDVEWEEDADEDEE